MKNNKELQKLKKKILNDKIYRINLAEKSFYWFCHIYLGNHFTIKLAPFQKELIKIAEDPNNTFSVIVAFRGSGKSTIISLAYVIWSMIGIQKKRHIVIIGQTQNQSRLFLKNVKSEFENNDLLIKDFGKFEDDTDEWKSNSLVFKKYKTRISALSTGETIRSLKHLENRPDLIICDDVEDLDSVISKERRDKTYDWLTSEVIPAGAENTKYIIIGNLLHEDSLMMRLKISIFKKESGGNYYEFPFFDENGIPLWQERYKNQESITALKNKFTDNVWQREFLLKIIPDSDRIIKREWIKYYDDFPDDSYAFLYTVTGVDLAIGEGKTHDFTSMVSAKVYKKGDDLYIYILPFPINKRMDSSDISKTIKELSLSLGHGQMTKVCIEEVGFQTILIQQLQKEGFPAVGIKPHGQDKQMRIEVGSNLVKQGFVLFPKNGTEDLITQLTNFGYEKHDDLADAYSYLIISIMEKKDSASNFLKFMREYVKDLK